MPDLNIAEELERYRKRLLDLTARNRLLNHRAGTKRSVRIVDELPDHVYAHLVERGRAFRFLPAPEITDDPPQPKQDAPPAELDAEADLFTLPQAEPDAESAPRRHADALLQTPYDDEELDARLNHIRREARSAIEETGANYCYLALGMLAWHEDDASDQPRSAPLILIPIQVERTFDNRIGRYRYAVRHTGEEIQSNISLREKLEHDFGLQLPWFTEGEAEHTPESYFEAVRDAVRSMPRWEVRREAVIGFFSFTKLFMYKDLDPGAWPEGADLGSNELLHDIFEGRERDAAAALYAEDVDIDNDDTARAIDLVLEADASQHSAVCDVAHGRSIVIEGPPGAGKSQTITNLIAWALGEGKTVLFVAEKLAALEVVRRNLEKVNLSELCLELHSQKARPLEVYKDLAARLEKRYRLGPNDEARRAELRETQQQLRDYLDATAIEVGPYDEPLYAVFGRVAEMRSRRLPRPDGAHVRHDLDRNALQDRLYLFDEIVRHADDIGAPESHPWRGFISTRFTEANHDDIRTILTDIRNAARDLADANDRLRPHDGEPWSVGLRRALEVTDADVAQTEPPEPIPHPDACAAVADPEGCGLVRRFIDDCDAWGRARDLGDAIDLRDPDAAPDAAREVVERIDAMPLWRPDAVNAQNIHAVDTDLEALQRAVAATIEDAQTLSTLGLPRPTTIADLTNAADAYARLAGPLTTHRDHINDAMFLGRADDALRRAIETRDDLNRRRDAVNAVLILDEAPENEQLTRIRTELRRSGRSLLRMLRGNYRNARAEARAFLQPDARFNPLAVADAISETIEWRADARAFAGDENLADTLGPAFRGLDTEWTALQALINASHELRRAGMTRSEADAVLNRINDADAPPTPENLRDHIRRLRDALTPRLDATPLGRGNWLASPDLAILDDLAAITDEARRDLADLLAAARPFILPADATLHEFGQRIGARVEADDIRQRIDADATCRDRLGDAHDGVATDTAPLRDALAWRDRLAALGMPDDLVAWTLHTDAQERAARIRTSLIEARAAAGAWSDGADRLAEFGRVNIDWLAGDAESGWADPAAPVARADSLLTQLDRLPSWSAFCRAITRLDDHDLAPFAASILGGGLSPRIARDAFEMCFWESVADAAKNADPTLRGFSRQRHEETRKRFQELDAEILKLNRSAIGKRAGAAEPPAGVQTGRVGEYTQLGLIRHEVQKKRRHVRIRQLMHRAGDALQALKPCFMMSPLSVAQYLPPGEITFDLLVIDEASQVRPEDAIGAIARARTFAVVGDPKQLPPTTFFDRMTAEDEFEEETLMDDAESILEVASKAYAPIRRLRGHYRSRHEDLIAFSNEKFYDGDLIIFPAANRDNGRLGVFHHFIEDADYARGRNMTEARAVADAIIEHARVNGHESLGVGAFNIRQRDLIEECLDKRCAEDPAAREALDNLLELRDPLFIKNLENLQGDERDVIFISYTYGPDDASRVVAQRFGPITGENGWRRLNVLITRAKRRVEVFSSMRPSDIVAGPDKSRGVNAMKDYLDYVSTGRLVDRGVPTGRGPDSPFEIAVARMIESMGLTPVCQVGVAGYRIDIGVLHPDRNDEFILGVECDGATYHRAKSVRDRDRLRELVIRSRGWRVHRIWSTDWFENPRTEENRLRDRITHILEHGDDQ